MWRVGTLSAWRIGKNSSCMVYYYHLQIISILKCFSHQCVSQFRWASIYHLSPSKIIHFEARLQPPWIQGLLLVSLPRTSVAASIPCRLRTCPWVRAPCPWARWPPSSAWTPPPCPWPSLAADSSPGSKSSPPTHSSIALASYASLPVFSPTAAVLDTFSLVFDSQPLVSQLAISYSQLLSSPTPSLPMRFLLLSPSTTIGMCLIDHSYPTTLYLKDCRSIDTCSAARLCNHSYLRLAC